MTRTASEYRRARRPLAVLVPALALLVCGSAAPAWAQTNLALNRPATASSTQESAFPASAAVDGNAGTRWSSAASDPQWLYVDLGAPTAINRVTLVWETAFGSAYQIQVSNDTLTWTNIYTTTTSDGGTDDITGLSGTGRYVRVHGTTRATQWGYSLWEMQVYGGTSTSTPTPTPTPSTSYVEVTPGAAGVLASANDGNVPANTVDNNLATRWSANGDGQWIRFDLGASRTVGHVSIAFYNGNTRQSRFDLQTSADGVTWTNAITGAASSGTSNAEQTFDFSDRAARFVRYLGHGNSVNAWNSLTEVSIFATGTGPVTPTPTPTLTPTNPSTTPTPTPTPTTPPTGTCPSTSNIALGKPAYAWYWDNGGGAPQFAVDGNATTRYSHLWYPSGPATGWWYVDLGATTATITGINITWEAALAADFQLQTSNDAASWSTIQNVVNNTSLNTNYSFSPGRTGRYVRINMTRKGTGFGYSFFEFQVMGCRAGNPAPTPAPTPLSGTYAMVWSDNFDGTSLNTTNWAHEDVHFNGEAQQYTPNNVTVSGGILRLTARRENNNGFQFTSGRIYTKNLRSWKYGRVVARMMLPVGEGYWSAFWMMGQDTDIVGWPGNGEIDIMENIGYPNWTSAALHGPGYWGAGSAGGINNLPSGSVNAWHTYATEWDPTYTRFFIDDILVRTVNRSDVTANGSQWVYDNNKFILLNLALGGDYPAGYNGCAGTPLPAGCFSYGLKQTTVDNIAAGQGVVQVDYVQVWQKR